jgi:hypothetical protein
MPLGFARNIKKEVLFWDQSNVTGWIAKFSHGQHSKDPIEYVGLVQN